MKTVRQLVEEYLERAKAIRGGRPGVRSWAFSMWDFARWLEASQHITRATDITPDTIGRWVQHAAIRPGAYNGRPRKVSSVQTQNRTLNVFCYWLADQGHVPRTVPESFPKPRRLPVVVKPTLRHREVKMLVRQLPDDTVFGLRTRALVEVLYSSGIRIAEALALDVPDVNLAEGTLRIRGKSDVERIAVIGRTARHHLAVYLQSVRPRLLRSPEEQALWLGHKGGRYFYDVFYRQWRRLMGKVLLPSKVTAHTFRRSFATELSRSGASPWEIKELLGHREVETLKYYVDPKIEDLKRTHARCHPRELQWVNDSSHI